MRPEFQVFREGKATGRVMGLRRLHLRHFRQESSKPAGKMKGGGRGQNGDVPRSKINAVACKKGEGVKGWNGQCKKKLPRNSLSHAGFFYKTKGWEIHYQPLRLSARPENEIDYAEGGKPLKNDREGGLMDGFLY